MGLLSKQLEKYKLCPLDRLEQHTLFAKLRRIYDFNGVRTEHSTARQFRFIQKVGSQAKDHSGLQY